jgi:hypothetical protein
MYAQQRQHYEIHNPKSYQFMFSASHFQELRAIGHT